VPANGNQPIDKGLGLPLPKDLVYRPYVATLWMDLVARFLARTNMELAVFLPQGAAKGQTEPPPMMYLGFTGGDAYHLAAMLDARGLDDDFVDIRQADWAQPLIEETYGTKKLSSYLQQPQLSLHQAVNTFAEAFLGQ
jgi:type VI secretion system protein ImpM